MTSTPGMASGHKTWMHAQVDGCSKLAAQQYLGAGPFYLYLGTQCSAGECPGNFLRTSSQL